MNEVKLLSSETWEFDFVIKGVFVICWEGVVKPHNKYNYIYICGLKDYPVNINEK